MTDIALPNQSQAVSQGTIVEQSRAVAEVAAAVRVARDFPRDPAAATEAMKELCSRLTVAQRAFYEVPNRGSGMSIHIARELARIWGNLDYGVRELRRDDAAGESEMSVWAWDQQTNVRNTRSFIHPHARMKNKRREALTDLSDIYLNNQNTGARAVRECIFATLPGWFVADADAILHETLKRGDGKPIEVRRAEAATGFSDRFHVTQKQLERRLQAPLDKWTVEHLAELTRIYTSIATDGIPAKEFFPERALTVTPALNALLDANDPAEPTAEEYAAMQAQA